MDNIYPTCPPKMSDGRLFTDYKQSPQLNEQIKYINGIVRDDEYRLFLQNNADKITNREWQFLRAKKSCWQNECVHKYPTRMYPPLFSEEIHNYNQLANPAHTPKFTCPVLKDYRMIAPMPIEDE